MLKALKLLYKNSFLHDNRAVWRHHFLIYFGNLCRTRLRLYPEVDFLSFPACTAPSWAPLAQFSPDTSLSIARIRLGETMAKWLDRRHQPDGLVTSSL